MVRDRLPWPEIKTEIISLIDGAEFFQVNLTRTMIKKAIEVIRTREVRRAAALQKVNRAQSKFWDALSDQEKTDWAVKARKSGARRGERKDAIGLRSPIHESGVMVGRKPTRWPGS